MNLPPTKRKRCQICLCMYVPFSRSRGYKTPTCWRPECKAAWLANERRKAGIHAPKECEICGKRFVPETSRQRTCGDDLCQRQRKRESRLELEARQSDAAMTEELRMLRKNRQRRLTDRQRRQEARQ